MVFCGDAEYPSKLNNPLEIQRSALYFFLFNILTASRYFSQLCVVVVVVQHFKPLFFFTCFCFYTCFFVGLLC